MEVQDKLEALGMSSKKSTIYLTLLQSGSCTVSEIAALAGIKRTTAQSILEPLLSEKLVSESRRGRWKVYSANKPEIMLTGLKSKENLIKEILPELNALYKVTGSKPVIQYFDGIEGARFAQRRLLESKERAYYYYASVREFSAILGNTFMKEFLEERKKRKIWANGIRNLEDNTVLPEYLRASKENLRRVRYFPNPINTEIPSINLTDNIIIITSTVAEAYGLIIESPTLTSLMKSIWKTVWDISVEK